MFVSVILPTYGRPEFLRRAIESVLAQTHEEFELIIVDDNSPDSQARIETETVVSLVRDGRLRYICQESNSGAPAARNAGISMAKGSFVTFLDDDDEYFPEKIEYQIRHVIDKKLDVSLCGAFLGKVNSKGRGKKIRPRGATLREFVAYGNALTPMIMIKKDLAKAVGGFDDLPRFEDHMFMFKMHERGAKVGLLKDALYFYNDHESQRLSNGLAGVAALTIKHEREQYHMGLLSVREQEWVRFRQAYSSLAMLAWESNDSMSGKPEIRYLWGQLLWRSRTPMRWGMTIKLFVKSAIGMVKRRIGN